MGASACCRRARADCRRTRAFTLIEVLVVVAIIALLISILLPSLNKARWQAKTVVCRANMHDIGNSLMMYTSANNGYFPVVPAYTDSYWLLWKTRNLKNHKVLICPGTQNRVRPETVPDKPVFGMSRQTGVPLLPWGGNGSDLDRVATYGAADSSGGHSYEYNDNYGGGNHPLALHHKTVNQFLMSSYRLVIVHDGDNADAAKRQSYPIAGCIGSMGALEPGGANVGNNCPQPWDNHGSVGMNFLYGDAHADWVQKFGGKFQDRTKTPWTTRDDENASIDLVWARSDAPWLYTK